MWPSKAQSFPVRAQADSNRYGWYRLYEDFCGHAKWLLVVERAGVELCRVEAIVQRLFQAAAKARADGYIGGFDIEVCAAGAKIPVNEVSAVYRVLEDMGWLKGGVIVDWADRNPRDKTATQRQQNKRARDEARRAMVAGTASEEQERLLDTQEREALQKLAALSRVTNAPPAPVAPAVPAIEQPFRPVQAPEENERAARAWLLGDGSRGLAYGPASKIVADNFGCRRMSADTTIRLWLRDQMAGDAVTLASIISAAFDQAITGEHFRNVVEGRMAEVIRERTAGAPLPLGFGAFKGGRTG